MSLQSSIRERPIDYTLNEKGTLVPIYSKKINLENYDFSKWKSKEQKFELNLQNIKNQKDYQDQLQKLNAPNEMGSNVPIKKEKYLRKFDFVGQKVVRKQGDWKKYNPNDLLFKNY